MKAISIEFSSKYVKFRQLAKMQTIKVFYYSLVLFLLNSCVSTTYLNSYTPEYTTSVSSFGNYNLVGKTFYIESGAKSISSSDVEFREYSNYIATTLKLQGAKETSDKKNADMCILVNYGISDESYTETVPVPIWGQTGISSISTSSNTTGSAYGSATRIGNSVYGSVQGNSSTNTTTIVNPSYGITGYTSVDRRVSRYCRVLNIYSYDNKQTAEPTMLWKTNLLSCGSSSDLKKVLPYMAYTAWGKLGNSTDGTESYTTLEDDYLFRCWKQGILNQSNITTFPNVNQTNVPSYMQIAIVEKTNSETILILRKSGCLSWYRIDPNTYIEYSGQKYFIKSIDNYTLGQKIKKECGVRYLRLHFPSIPDNAKYINVKENVENGWEWNGVTIR